MATVFSVMPDPESLLALEPEELAGILLEYLNSLPDQKLSQLNRFNFSLPSTVQEYPSEYHDSISHALMEAWVWLEREGLLAPKPRSTGEYVFITRRGRQLKSASDVDAYRRGSMLPRRLLHPLIAQKVWATFLRGDYDTAVFQAFKEVEVTVRTRGALEPEDIGPKLMRKAFHPVSGPLTDSSLPRAERESLAHLFAGAMGWYKNPGSHREVQIEAQEAVEMIVLASHLLQIVDSRDQAG